MKIFNGEAIREIDSYTIRQEGITSADLMERAASALFTWIVTHLSLKQKFIIFCGPGNNGGDGLALGRMLLNAGCEVDIYYVFVSSQRSSDWLINMERLRMETGKAILNIASPADLPVPESHSVIVDAIFGSGLSKRPSGIAAEVIKFINNSGALVISVDIPSGLFGENNSGSDKHAIIRADFTLCFQFPRLAFMFAGNDQFTGQWEVLPIGLSQERIRTLDSPWHFTEASQVASLLKQRKRFDHKGVFGHGLLLAGSCGKAGASILASRAALRSGIGLLSCHIPRCAYTALQSAVPEAMVNLDTDEDIISELPSSVAYSAVGAGPGLGRAAGTGRMLYNLLKQNTHPLVLDADALNILSENKEWLGLIAENSVLTPHPGEFRRLSGSDAEDYDRLMLQIQMAQKLKAVVVLKGAFTSIALPSGKVQFNSSGNPGMATAGSGDVLTGIILSLLAGAYSPEDAAVIAVYVHGLAADIAAETTGQQALIASDIVDNLGRAFCRLNERNK